MTARRPHRRAARRHRPTRCREDCRSRDRTVRPSRYSRQQRRQLQSRVLREIAPEDFRDQIETALFGPIDLARLILPTMRAQRSGLVITISSTARHRGHGVLHRLRRLQVRSRGMDGVAIDLLGHATRHSSPTCSSRSCGAGATKIPGTYWRCLCERMDVTWTSSLRRTAAWSRGTSCPLLHST